MENYLQTRNICNIKLSEALLGSVRKKIYKKSRDTFSWCWHITYIITKRRIIIRREKTTHDLPPTNAKSTNYKVSFTVRKVIDFPR